MSETPPLLDALLRVPAPSGYEEPAAAERGELVLGGALADPYDRALLVWDVEDRAVVEAFVEQDPYVREGLVTSWAIRPWTTVVGSALPDS